MISEEREVDWAEEFNGAVTVCNREGIIVYMNQCSIRQFAKYGGSILLGTNLLDCHPEPSKSKLKKMLESPTDNIYTTESADGSKRLIYQTPWRINGAFKGIIEWSIMLDSEVPNHNRK